MEIDSYLRSTSLLQTALNRVLSIGQTVILLDNNVHKEFIPIMKTYLLKMYHLTETVEYNLLEF